MTQAPNNTFSDDGPVSLDLPMAGRAVVFTNGGSMLSFPTSAWPQALRALGLAPEAPPKLMRRQRKPTLVSVAKQANKAAIPVARYEVKPDGTITVITGEPTPVEPGNPWPLDEFRTKENKQ